MTLCNRPLTSSQFLLFVMLVIVAFGGCNSQSATTTGESAVRPEKPTVFVVNYPLAYFAQRVGGDAIDVAFPVPDEFDPAYWSPDAEAIAAFQSAELIFLNGADYAKWTLRATLPASRTIVTTRDVQDRFIEVADAVTHSHGPEGEHVHAALASETWLDPRVAIDQARVIKEELEKLIPESSDSIEANFNALVADLRSMDEALESTFAKSSGLWIASHSAFSYLARRYSLELRIVHWEPNEYPSDDQWQELEELVASHPASWMLWEDEPMQETFDRLRTLGVRVAVFRPAATRPKTGDYLTTMRRNLERLQAAVPTSS